MSSAATPAPANPSQASSRQGFHVPVWVAVVSGLLLVLIGGFVVGRAVGRNRDHLGVARRGFMGAGRDAHVGHPFLWLLVFLVVVIVVVSIVVALVRRSAGNAASQNLASPGTPAPPSGAEELLAQRFARGEIDESEFRARRDALRS